MNSKNGRSKSILAELFDKNRIPLLAIVGPTATGKTALGVKLAKYFSGEIVSADSMQVYEGAPIATAVPSSQERQGVKHHLMEILSPDATFTVSDYAALADAAIQSIIENGKLPILVGGTGLYIEAVVDHIRFLPAPADGVVRGRLAKKMQEVGSQVMLEELSRVDPVTAARLHPNDKRRILRALELYELTGRTLSEQNALSKAEASPYDPLIIGLNYRDRAALYRRIDERVEQMLQKGLLAEAQKMLETPCKGMAQAIGHKELFPYLRGEQALSECVERLKRETRRYAKRQLTWFRRDERIHWIYLDEARDPFAAAKELLCEKGWAER